MKPSERKRLEELKKKYRPEPEKKPYFWQAPLCSGMVESFVTKATIKQLDRLAASTIRRWSTDWSQLDRKTAMKRLICGLPFVFIPRHTGCYLSWPDAWKPEFPAINEYDPGENGRIWNFYQKDRPEGLRFFFVSHGLIVESEDVCRAYMETVKPNLIMYGDYVSLGLKLLKSAKSGEYIVTDSYDKDLGIIDASDGFVKRFDSLEDAKSFISERELEQKISVKEKELNRLYGERKVLNEAG